MTKQATKVRLIATLAGLATVSLATSAQAVTSAELYTAKGYMYGRFESRVQFAAGDGIISSFFLWKDGSEKADVFWNELDFEKLGADCHLETNAFYGLPQAVHIQKPTIAADLCGGFHTYTFEWTPEYIAWLVDGTEVRRETGDAAVAFRDNAAPGMQLRFNIWPGNASFGGNFSPDVLPVHQYINWVQYSSYADGVFTLEWREDFTAESAPAGWLTGNWGSPKNLSEHSPANVNYIGGYAVLSLTADEATGAAGATPLDTEVPAATGGTTGAGGATTDSSVPGVGGASAGTVGGATGVASTTAPEPTSSGGDDGGCSLVGPSTRQASGLALWLGGAAMAWLLRRSRHRKS